MRFRTKFLSGHWFVEIILPGLNLYQIYFIVLNFHDVIFIMQLTRNYAETVLFHKISTPGNSVKLRYFSQCYSSCKTLSINYNWKIFNYSGVAKMLSFFSQGGVGGVVNPSPLPLRTNCWECWKYAIWKWYNFQPISIVLIYEEIKEMDIYSHLIEFLLTIRIISIV